MSNHLKNQQMHELSKITATSIVAKVLRKHGIDKSSLSGLTENDRSRVRSLVTELQKQAETMSTKTTESE